jgi:transposase
VTLLEPTLDGVAVQPAEEGAEAPGPQRLVCDKGYDCDALRARLLSGRGIDLICPHRKNRKRRATQDGRNLICPHRKNRKRRATQDGRKLRRYKRRWKVERTFAWLGNFRRLVVRYERSLKMYRAFFHVACLLITLRKL